MGMCYCVARSRREKLNLRASDELTSKGERIISLKSSPHRTKFNSRYNLLDQSLSKKFMTPLNVVVKGKESAFFEVTENIAKQSSSTGNVVVGKSTANESAKGAHEHQSIFEERNMSLRRRKWLQYTGGSASNVSKSSLRGSYARRIKKKRLVPKIDDPILISSFGELADDKPLKFFMHDDWSCSLTLGATSFEMLWDHGDAVIPTRLSILRKSSLQRSPKIWITGSVTKEPKAFILNPAKLIVSISGVEIGLSREVGGLLRSDDSVNHSQLGNSASSFQMQSSCLPSLSGDTWSSASIKTITPSWFACEGFFLNSTSKDQKGFLAHMWNEDIADVLWEYLPESKFKDRARSIYNGEEYQLKGVEMFKPFKVVASSIKDVVVSTMDLEAVVCSSCDGASASVFLNDLNGLYLSPHKWLLLARRKIQAHWESDHLLRDSDQVDEEKIEFHRTKTTTYNQVFNRNIKGSASGSNYLTVTIENNDPINRETLSRGCSPQDQRMGFGKTCNSLKSLSNVDALLRDELTRPEVHSINPENQAIIPIDQSISSGEQTSSFNAEVTATTDPETPNWVPSNHKRHTNLTSKELLELIDEFETRVKDAILDALSSDDNQCRWVADDGTNGETHLSETTKEIFRKRAKRAEQKAEDQSRRMAILLRPKGGFPQNITYSELEFVGENYEFSADSGRKNTISNIKKSRFSTTNEFRDFHDISIVPNIETTIGEGTDHHVTPTIKEPEPVR